MNRRGFIPKVLALLAAPISVLSGGNYIYSKRTYITWNLQSLPSDDAIIPVRWDPSLQLRITPIGTCWVESVQ